MKITCLFGSPRSHGNSTTLAKHFLTASQKLGAEIKTFELNNLQYRGCQGCLICKTKLEKCVLQDDLTAILDSVRETDVLVIASSVYYGDVTSQMKGFIDRIYSFYVSDFLTNPNKSRLEPGKRLVMILTQGNPDERLFADIFPKYNRFFKVHGFQNNQLIRACGVVDQNDIQKRQDLFTMAEHLAAKLMS